MQIPTLVCSYDMPVSPGPLLVGQPVHCTVYNIRHRNCPLQAHNTHWLPSVAYSVQQKVKQQQLTIMDNEHVEEVKLDYIHY